MTIKAARLAEAVTALAALYLLAGFLPPRPQNRMDVAAFAGLPVLNGGRVKPLDTVARTSLLVLRGKQTVRAEGRTMDADTWLLDMLYKSKTADTYPVFEIDDPDVLGIMGMEQTANRHYRFAELRPHLADIEAQARQAESVKADARTRFQTAVTNLQNRIILYQRLQNSVQIAGEEKTQDAIRQFKDFLAPLAAMHMKGERPKVSPELAAFAQQARRYEFIRDVAEFLPVPGPRGFSRLEWVSWGQGALDTMTAVEIHPAVRAYAALGDAWRAADAPAFRQAAAEYKTWLDAKVPREAGRARAEQLFNRYAPFYRSMILYLAVFLLALASFLARPAAWLRAAYWLLVLSFGVHTGGLIARMLLQGRPPVTNLYSSAIFVGWAAVLLGIALERIYRNGLGSLVASMIGFTTLIIAHHLAAQGDTLEMMRAVLDSNFWLATHVVCITIGYSATFLAGFLGVLYVLRQKWDRAWSPAKAAELERMTYGIVCFSLLFSFVGTILGGIWADQSWGRFWGWDPKENGALMIVLWNALILHARLGNLAKPKDVMVMAVAGNIVTACSWFGVNMLGIGLHSYGWMDQAFTWLALFVATQLVVIILGLARPEPLKGKP